MTTLRVATFNIRNGLGLDGWNIWPLRRRATADAIASLDADVVGLQEVYGFQRRFLVKRLGAYSAEWSGRRDGRKGEACPVLVRTARVSAVAARSRWFADEPDVPGGRLAGASFPRLATICRLRVDGVEIEVANTHLDEAVAENRLRSVMLLLDWLDPTVPRVVLGDLNAEPDDTVLQKMHDAGLHQALPAGAGGTNHDFTGRTDGRRIDHILVSDDFRVERAEIVTVRPGGRLPSDHWPVVADLRL